MALRDSPSCERERESKVRYDVLKLISYLSTVQLGIDLFDLSLLSLFHKKYSPSLILSLSCSLSLLTLAQALLLSALQPAPPHSPPLSTHTHTWSYPAGALHGPGHHGASVCPITGFMDCLSLWGVTNGVAFQSSRYAFVTLDHFPAVCSLHQGEHRLYTCIRIPT